jgi:thioredoxin 1
VGGNISTLNDSSFEGEISGATLPILVDFWAEWCGPCRMIAPVLQEIADEQGEKLQIVKVNVDESLEVARRYEVMSIPTLILFKDGQPALRLIGAKGKGQLLEELQAFL